MHFMNPVPVMQLVEVARGVHTSQQTFESCKGLAEFLGKQVCTSQDRPVSQHRPHARAHAWTGAGGARAALQPLRQPEQAGESSRMTRFCC
jgi:hypothetical protein